MVPPTRDEPWSNNEGISKHSKIHLSRLIRGFVRRERLTVIIFAHYIPHAQEGIAYNDGSPDRLRKYPALQPLVREMGEKVQVLTSHDFARFRSFILSGVPRFSLTLHSSSSQSCNNIMFRSAFDLRVTSPSNRQIIWYSNSAWARANFSWGVFVNCCCFNSFRLWQRTLNTEVLLLLVMLL